MYKEYTKKNIWFSLWFNAPVYSYGHVQMAN